jgi:hypothetical protein
MTLPKIVVTSIWQAEIATKKQVQNCQLLQLTLTGITELSCSQLAPKSCLRHKLVSGTYSWMFSTDQVFYKPLSNGRLEKGHLGRNSDQGLPMS